MDGYIFVVVAIVVGIGGSGRIGRRHQSLGYGRHVWSKGNLEQFSRGIASRALRLAAIVWTNLAAFALFTIGTMLVVLANLRTVTLFAIVSLLFVGTYLAAVAINTFRLLFFMMTYLYQERKGTVWLD